MCVFLTPYQQIFFFLLHVFLGGLNPVTKPIRKEIDTSGSGENVILAVSEE